MFTWGLVLLSWIILRLLSRLTAPGKACCLSVFLVHLLHLSQGIVCADADVQCIFQPCHHVVCCQECWAQHAEWETWERQRDTETESGKASMISVVLMSSDQGLSFVFHRCPYHCFTYLHNHIMSYCFPVLFEVCYAMSGVSGLPVLDWDDCSRVFAMMRAELPRPSWWAFTENRTNRCEQRNEHCHEQCKWCLVDFVDLCGWAPVPKI